MTFEGSYCTKVTSTVSILDIVNTVQRHKNLPASSSNQEGLINVLKNFVDQNENPSSSSNFVNKKSDNLDWISDLFERKETYFSSELFLLVLKALKILSRKEENRSKVGYRLVSALDTAMAMVQDPCHSQEAAQAVLNICLSRENVLLVLSTNIIQSLVFFLTSENEEVYSAAAGAIQSICVVREGKAKAREMGAVDKLTVLLRHESKRVVARVIGALHNISSESDSVPIIRTFGGVPLLLDILNDCPPELLAQVTGTLQNISREEESRGEIIEIGGVAPILKVLFCDDVNAQAAAVGALLNLLGPEIQTDGEEDLNHPKRQELRQLLSSGLLLGCLQSIFEDEESS